MDDISSDDKDSAIDKLTIVSAIIGIAGVFIALGALVYWAVVRDVDEWFWILLIFGIVLFIVGLVGIFYSVGRRRKQRAIISENI